MKIFPLSLEHRLATGRVDNFKISTFLSCFLAGIYTKYKQLLAKDKLIFRRLSKVSAKLRSIVDLSVSCNRDHF